MSSIVREQSEQNETALVTMAAVDQLESGDFRSYSEEFYDLPREFGILGSCLFHRGMLVANHLPRDDMVDVTLWIKHQKLLRQTSSVPFRRVVAWNEISLTRNSQRPGIDSISSETSQRTFLLVVGLGYQLLAVLLECESAAVVDVNGPGDPISPDPFYVDQVLLLTQIPFFNFFKIHVVR